MHISASSLGKRKDGVGSGDRRPEESDGDHPAVTQPDNVDDFFQGLPEENVVEEGGDPSSDDSGDDGSGDGSDDESGNRGD